MKARSLATELGDLLKYDTTANGIDRTARSIFPVGCAPTAVADASITSVRARKIYDWIQAIDKYAIPNQQKMELVVEFVKRLAPDDKLPEVEKILVRNAIPETLGANLTTVEAALPDIARFTASNAKLHAVIEARWFEAQTCQKAGAFLSAVILMGSILEALLLSRCLMSMSDANQSAKTPKDKKTGNPIPVQNWSLNSLVDVSTDLGWLKLDRGKFSHALRESRNIVHPWAHAAAADANFDLATCKTSWSVLVAAIDDLNRSI